MNFISLSLASDNALSQFRDIFSQDNSEKQNFFKKLSLCNYEVILISRDKIIPTRLINLGINQDELQKLINTWIEIGNYCLDIENQKKAWKIIDNIGEIVSTDKNMVGPLLRRIQVPTKMDLFFILLTGREKDGLPVFELNYLLNLWQLENGRIVIHASGVVHKGKLLLFGGPSGAGKSTISIYGRNQGDEILDEDQILLNEIYNGKYSAQAWGYSLTTSKSQLTAVVKLIKDNTDYLVEMPQFQAAQFLLERNFDILGQMLDQKYSKMVFSFVSKIARHIPSYELHFRKSPDFWKVIDAEFGLD